MLLSGNSKTLPSCFFVFQGTASIVWWCLMLSDDKLHNLFFGPLPWKAAMTFILPDAIYYVIGSYVCAWAIHQSPHWRTGVLLLMTGGCGYATLLTIGLACSSHTGWIGPCLMLASLMSTVALTLNQTMRQPDK